MLKVFHQVESDTLSAIQLEESQTTLTYTPHEMRSASNRIKIPLYKDPGPEQLRTRLSSMLVTFEQEYRHKPGYVLFARQKDLVALALFVFGPPAGATIVQKFDFE